MGICNYLQHVIYNLIYDNRTQTQVAPTTREDSEKALYYPARKLDLLHKIKKYKLSYPQYKIIKDSLHDLCITDEELFFYLDYFIENNIDIHNENKLHLMCNIIRTKQTPPRVRISNNNNNNMVSKEP